MEQQRQVRRPAHSRGVRAAALLMVAALIGGACDSGGDGSSSTGSGGTTGGGAAPRVFGLRLSEGQAVGEVPAAATLVEGDALSAASVAAIRARLPEWAGGTGDAESFSWPTQSVPPPLTGATIDEKFPPAVSMPPPDTPSGALHVLRFQPEGEVSIAPYVSITFDQPMVPVGTLGQIDEFDVPASITPSIPGRWQWVGTRTLRFDHDSSLIDRLPMATSFTVEVPAGTRSATGGVLGADVSFAFTTPTPEVVSFWPQGDGLDLDTVFVASFDQRVDPDAVLAAVHLRAGDDEVAVRLATEAEIKADAAARQALQYAEDGRWAAFRARDLLPRDTKLAITIGPETPSAEGPNRSSATTTFEARTYAPLRITGVSCPSDAPCSPGSSMSVMFNNPLDAARSAAALKVAPALAGMRVAIEYSSVTITGATQPRTTYTITVPASFTDVHGQTLGDDEDATAHIAAAMPSIAQLGAVTTLDPFAASQQLSVVSVNHDRLRVRTFAADPSRVADYYRYLERRDSTGATLSGWTVLSDDVVSVRADDSAVETPIDLTDVLGGASGHLIVLVEPVPAVLPTANDYWSNRPAVTWVQSTRLGVDAFSDAQRLYAWVTDLRTGAPVQGVGVALQSLGGASAERGTTDRDGATNLAMLPLAPQTTSGAPNVLVATKGTDSAILPVDAWLQTTTDAARWFVFDDRAVYRPGETIRVKGWVRRLTLADTADIAAVARGSSVAWNLTDAYGNELAKGTVATGSLGGFDLSIDVPESADLGPATLHMELRGDAALAGATYWHQVQVQQYRTPDFEVITRAESPTPFLSTSPATVAANGSYYAGGPLAEAPVSWLVSTTPTTYSPPGWDRFTFGIWSPWWYVEDRTAGDGLATADVAGGMYIDGGGGYPVSPTDVAQYSGTTDASGTHYLQIDFLDADGALPDLPVAVSAQATITDVNRQAWSSTSDFLVHAADRYVGLRTERTFVGQGDPLSIEAIVTDIDGAAVVDASLSVSAGRVEWQYTDGAWSEVVTDEQTCALTSGAEPEVCDFETDRGGEYRVTAVVADAQGGRNRTELTTWVSGGESVPSRSVEQQSLTVVPDAVEYAVGDTAELLVQAPFTSGEGYAVVVRNGVRSTQRFTVVDGSSVLRLPITEADVPQVTVTLEVVGATQRTAADGTVIDDMPDRPAYATGSLSLAVPPLTRALDVSVVPRDRELTPGSSTTLDVRVRDANGAAVKGAEFAVVVVDEAVLALSGYTLADPLEVFYAPTYDAVTTHFGRSHVQLALPSAFESVDRDESTPATDAAADGGAVPPADVDDGYYTGDKNQGGSEAGGSDSIEVRSRFDALALFEPSVVTSTDGSASIPLTLPDSLTRYRVMVVAVSGSERFGRAETNITARLPLSVRPAAPRFANFGDAFELPVVVQNLGTTQLAVDVVLEGSNLTVVGATGDGSAIGRSVSVPAGERVEVRFPVRTQQAGTAGFRVTVVSGALSDSATVQLPVYTPATAEAFATYGVIDDGAIAQPLVSPRGVIEAFGGLEVSTSSTALQALTDAVIDLVEYPYDSSDGMAARILTIAALHDVLDAFDAAGLPSASAIDASMKSDIADLVALQNGDGGFPYWLRNNISEPFNSVQATHALVVARAEGYVVPRAALEMALAHTANIESYIPVEYGEQQRDTIRTYALWVRALAGQRDPAKAAAIYAERGSALAVDALAWLWPSLDDAPAKATVRRTIANRAVETASTANFTTTYDDRSYLVMASDRRTDGIVLDALIDQDPSSDLIPKVVAGLLAGRVRGSWQGVQENTFVLLALDRYFRTFESQSPNFVARVWLGDRFAGEHTFIGRTTERVRLGIGMSDLLAAGDVNLVLSNTGSGRMYYRIALRSAPTDLQLDALDRGFVVDRVYEAVDDADDVRRDADGTWHVKAGARVRVTLTMVAESQRTHVALIDPLPAGFESLNPALAVTQSTVMPTEGGDSGAGVDTIWSWWWQWYDHEQLRTDRTEAFATMLGAGTYSYSYVARATTIGTFVVPPARAEEMYAPETFGRTATDRVMIER